jgi:hypothetical protein
MNALIFIFTYIGIMAAIFGSGYLVMKTLEYFFDLQRTLSECRDALKRLEGKH